MIFMGLKINPVAADAPARGAGFPNLLYRRLSAFAAPPSAAPARRRPSGNAPGITRFAGLKTRDRPERLRGTQT